MARFTLRTTLSVVCALFLVAIQSVSTFAQTAAPASVFVTAVDSSDFPNITVYFRAVDATNRAISTLSSADLDVYEDTTSVQDFVLDRAEPAPIYTVFLIDRGQYSWQVDDAVVREALSRFASDNYFRDGVDKVAILERVHTGQDQTVTRLPETDSARDFLQTVGALQFGETSKTNSAQGMEFALNEVARLIPDPGASPAVIIYVGAFFDGAPVWSGNLAAAQTTAERAKNQFVTLYVLDIRGTQQDYILALRALADGSYGQYLLLQNNNNHNGALSGIYAEIAGQTATYKLTYHSGNANPGKRDVAIVPNNTPLSQANLPGEYSVSDQKPTVKILRPDNGATVERVIEERVDAQGNKIQTLIPNAVEVAASVTLPDSRSLKSASLIAQGSTVSTISAQGKDQFIFSYDISDLTVEGVFERDLTVSVIDEFGFESAASVKISVSVPKEIVIPPTPTPAPTPTIPPTIQEICKTDPNNALCSPEAQVVRWVPWVGFAATGAVAFVLFLNRRKLAAAGVKIVEAAREVRKTIIGGRGGRGQIILAKLHIDQARKDLQGQSIPIFAHTTSFGRDPKLCDVQLYDEDDNSTVSGLHFTLQYEKGRDVFLLTDNNSSVGTQIDGRPVQPNDPIALRDGAEIVLGELYRRGAKLRFERVKPANLGATEVDSHDPRETIVDDDLYGAEPTTGDTTIIDMGDDFGLEPPGGNGKQTLKADDDWLSQLD